LPATHIVVASANVFLFRDIFSPETYSLQRYIFRDIFSSEMYSLQRYIFRDTFSPEPALTLEYLHDSRMVEAHFETLSSKF
jgi:hypothetical protein